MVVFSKESLETLRQRIDLVDVLSSHVDMKRAGAAYKALCPFHDEKTPSFTVQKGDTHYHCFGCGAHGDAISFLMGYLKMSFSDAVESLAARFNVHIEKEEFNEGPKGPPKSRLKDALSAAAHFYHFALLHTHEGHEALRYLYGRGIDLEFIRQFEIGLAPKSPGVLRKVLHEQGFNDEILLHAGLLSQHEERGIRDFFHDRITFPIHDASGSVIGFSARKYREETFGGKYVNTAETKLFKKSRVLFGLHHSRRRIAKERKAIIVEGQIDALRLIKAGLNITVAGQGTAFGEGHAKELIALGVQTIYLSLDGDIAGQEAAKKIGNLFQREGIEVFVLKMPPRYDPDLLLREKGAEGFIDLMQKAEDYITFLVKHESKQLNSDSPAGKHELVKNIGQQIRDWDNPLMVHESLRKLSHLTHVPEHIVGVGQTFISPHYIKKSDSVDQHEVDPDKVLEGDLLRWLLLMGQSYPQLIQLVKSHLTSSDFRVPLCRNIFETYMRFYDNQQSCDLINMTIQLEDPAAQHFLSELMHNKRVNRERAEAQLLETIQKILDRNWMEKREEIRMKIQTGNCSDEEVLELAKQFDLLKKSPPKVSV